MVISLIYILKTMVTFSILPILLKSFNHLERVIAIKAQDIMTKKIISVEKDCTVKNAAEKMAEADVGSVIVNDHDSSVGIITDRDIAIRGVAKYNDVNTTKCEDIMSPDLVTADTNTDMEEVVNLMADHQIKRVPIVENDSVVGMVSLRDISQSIEWEEEAGEVLNNITDHNHEQNTTF